jgi:hypothetical protein
VNTARLDGQHVNQHAAVCHAATGLFHVIIFCGSVAG